MAERTSAYVHGGAHEASRPWQPLEAVRLVALVRSHGKRWVHIGTIINRPSQAVRSFWNRLVRAPGPRPDRRVGGKNKCSVCGMQKMGHLCGFAAVRCEAMDLQLKLQLARSKPTASPDEPAAVDATRENHATAVQASQASQADQTVERAHSAADRSLPTPFVRPFVGTVHKTMKATLNRIIRKRFYTKFEGAPTTPERRLEMRTAKREAAAALSTILDWRPCEPHLRTGMIRSATRRRPA